MPDKMVHFYRPWYVWLMRIAHFRWARVVVAVVIAVLFAPHEATKRVAEVGWFLVRDAREGDWS